MKNKFKWILSMLVVIILLMGILIIWNKDMGKASKQVRETVKFLDNMIDAKAIDENSHPKVEEVQEVKSISTSNSTVAYTLIWKNCGVDLDEDYNVVGYLNQSENEAFENKLKEAKCYEYASNYLKTIITDKFKYSSSQNNEDENSYTFTFYRYHKKYPNYNNEIKLKINKETGKLVSYSAFCDENMEYKSNILLTEKRAISKAEEYCSEMFNEKIKILGQTTKGYFNAGENKYVLCYIINYKITEGENQDKQYSILITTDDGTVLNNIEK